MATTRFDPTGNLTDLGPEARAEWSDWLSRVADSVIRGRTENENDSPRAQFYNLAKTETAADAVFQDVSWTAFPRRVKVDSTSDRGRWAAAEDDRMTQDEYCEWSCTRDSDGKITRAVFTCESPEYWRLLARRHPRKLVTLYRKYIDPSVQKSDLFDGDGDYVPRNKWNAGTAGGAMHLTGPENTIGGAMQLSAAATIVRVIDGRTLTGEQELIQCSAFGEPERNSDPHIGGVVNSVARMKADIALANPVGLYFSELSTAGWMTPDGTDPQTFWSYERGDKKHPVRGVLQVPADKGYVVGDITILGKPISYGGQIADYLSVKATVVACRIGKSAVEPMTGCVRRKQANPSSFAAPTPSLRRAIQVLDAP